LTGSPITRPESVFPAGIFVIVPAQAALIVTGHLKPAGGAACGNHFSPVFSAKKDR
jgi:hypothetical protein